MSSQLILISGREEDLRFCEFLAFANDLKFKPILEGAALGRALAEADESIVLWDGDDAKKVEALAPVLNAKIPTAQSIVLTDKSLNDNVHLAQWPVFGHHFFRRYEDPATALYARLIGAIRQKAPFGLQRYFPEGAASRKINITRSGQKHAAVEAVQNIFIKQNVNTRLSALVAQAVDELLMNAIFDAPVLPNGMPLRRGTDRSIDFELIAQEYVFLELASADDFVGISVTDQFGSLKKAVLMSFLGRDYEKEAYVVRKSDPGAGLGLHGIIQSGISMMFLSQPGVKTEVMIFFSKAASYKDFRGGFRFLSIQAP